MKAIPLLFALLSALPGTAQKALIDSVNRKRTQINISAMAVLGSWALVNVGSGLVVQANIE